MPVTPFIINNKHKNLIYSNIDNDGKYTQTNFSPPGFKPQTTSSPTLNSSMLSLGHQVPQFDVSFPETLLMIVATTGEIF